MAQTLLEIRSFPRESSLFSYALSDSQRTTTDTSTIWGPGTLSGRALLALGEVTIRGINSLVIRRRLATIRLRAPTLNKSMCDDLLELSRPGLYSASIGKEAHRLVLSQICAESQYSMLVLAVCDWSKDEARLIILALIQSSLGFLSAKRGEEIYNFLIAIIQAKDEWKDLVMEAAQLLRSTFQDQRVLISHPLHIVCTETPAQLLPLSTLQKSYSPKMRAKIWLSLHTDGLPWQKRMLGIEETMGQYQASQLDSSSPVLLDAITDVIIFTRPDFSFDLQSAAIRCLRKMNNPRWKRVCELFGFTGGPSIESLDLPNDSQKTLPLRFSPNAHSAEELADAQEVLRKVSSNTWDSSFAFDKLAKLCIYTAFPSQINDGAILLTLRNICHDLASSRTQVALGVCALTILELRRVIEVLIRDVHLILCSMDLTEKISAIRSFCDFLATVFQVEDPYNKISRSMAIAVIQLSRQAPEMEHPVVHVCREIADAKPMLPFSKIQAIHSCDYRQNIWIALQASGMDLDARLLEVTSILPTTDKSTRRSFDALADAVIFTSEAFGDELRNSAITCLLDHCVKSRQWDILHQVFSFDSRVQRLMFTTLRTQLSQAELCDWIRAYPPSAHVSDLFLLLSGWAIGIECITGTSR
ncbi:hypothetical protein K438DRAFT_2017472 [Mycena galopus ATCC 62051]|nr:hypothetical protein K438DRAFT_2017472 [Mycena galopus ATCC 62051]